jgi:hypothetical protein
MTRNVHRTAKFMKIIPCLFGLSLAMIAAAAPAEASFSKAKYHGKIGICKGTYPAKTIGKRRYDRAFLHIWNKTCWSCPTGYKRTANPNVKGAKACKRKGKKSHARASKHKKVKLFGKCPKGQFVFTLNQTCYSCPSGYRRSASPNIAGKKACIRKTKTAYAAGKYRGKPAKACRKGTFLSLRKGGECWSCPSTHKHRTINKVTGGKACAAKFTQILSADTSGLCRTLITAVNAGSQGVAKISKQVERFTSPVMGRVNKAASGLSNKIKSPKELNKILNKAVAPLLRDKAALRGLDRFAKKLNAQRTKIKRAMMDPKMVCNNRGQGLVNVFKSLDLLPKKRAGLLDGALIKSAHASTARRPHIAVALSNSGRSSANWHGATIGLTFVSNGDQHRIFLSFGPITYFSTRAGYDITLSGAYFHRAQITSFDLIDHLGLEFGFAKGKWLDDWLDKLTKKYPTRGAVLAWLPGGINVSTDPLFKEFPGIGTNFISTGDPNESGRGLGPIDASASIDVTVQLIKIR